LAVAENYPQLHATENFAQLQAQLEGTENRISVERGRFNDAVQAYDTSVRSFPAVLYASMFGFQTKPYFSAVTGAQTPPQVQFNFNNSATTAP
jgi:LemA protein